MIPGPLARRRNFATQVVPRTFAKSNLDADEQVHALVEIASRAGLTVAAEFLLDVWQAAAYAPEENPAEELDSSFQPG